MNGKTAGYVRILRPASSRYQRPEMNIGLGKMFNSAAAIIYGSNFGQCNYIENEVLNKIINVQYMHENDRIWKPVGAFCGRHHQSVGINS